MTEYDVISGREGREVETRVSEVFDEGKVEMVGGDTILLGVLTPDKIRQDAITVVTRSVRFANGRNIGLEYWTGDPEKCMELIERRVREAGFELYIIEIGDLEEDTSEAREVMNETIAGDRERAVVFVPKSTVADERQLERRRVFAELKQLILFDE